MVEKRLCVAILRVLRDSDGYMLPQDIMASELQLRIVPPPTPQQILANLDHVKSQGWAAFEVDSYNTRKWFITNAGKVELRRG